MTSIGRVNKLKSILTIKETAEYLRVSRSTIWRWCRDGTLSSAFRVGRGWRISRSEVEGIVSGGTQKQTTPQQGGNDNNTPEI